ncbi:hypothetical protein F2Q70_00021165 [Brassica cretica]|uniref:Uncharacterized protein n=1 Tax=Brassica cretica TaxID=69181 RepID=A0A8S9GX75_BRACR|nr:hypothetical protein F2Q70_00021165 [Brassica cretica]
MRGDVIMNITTTFHLLGVINKNLRDRAYTSLDRVIEYNIHTKFSDHVPAQKNRPARDPHPRRDRTRPASERLTPETAGDRPQLASAPIRDPIAPARPLSLSKGGPVLNPLQSKGIT